MGLLDFLKIPKWKEAQRGWEESFEEELENDETEDELSPEEDYWYIDENEEFVSQKNLSEFYKQCICEFEKFARSECVIKENVKLNNDLEEIGRRITKSFLNDRYIVHRKETQPDIFYNYEVSLAIQSGIVIAKKWRECPSDIEVYADKIIRETPAEDIESLYGNGLVWNNDLERIKFDSKIVRVWHELLKWYYKNEEFEQFIEYSLLAAFNLGVNIFDNQK